MIGVKSQRTSRIFFCKVVISYYQFARRAQVEIADKFPLQNQSEI